MNARRPDAGKCCNTARQFAFHGAHSVHVLLKRSCGQAFIAIENFIADIAASGEAFARKRKPNPPHLIVRHHDPRAIAVNTVGHLGAIKRRNDLAGITLIKISVKQAHHGLPGPNNEPCDQAKHQKRRAHQGSKPPHPQGAQLSDEIPHQPQPSSPSVP